ncbi:hypothetical protein CD786_18865 [Escherichia coli O157:H7]|nr:hypothetical protein CD786_18865 [Escherichia coli O157:H7]
MTHPRQYGPRCTLTSKSGLSSKGSKEIEDDELAAYKKMANAFLAFSNKQIEDLIETGFLIEVKNER